MKSDRATARVVGVLFIVGTVAGGLGLALSQPLVDASDSSRSCLSMKTGWRLERS